MSPILPLEARGVVARRGRATLLGPLDLDLDGVGVVAVMGPNGAGKTTLLRLLHGLQRLSEGELRFAAPLEEARRRQAFVFQQPILLRRDVLANIAYPLRLRGVDRKAARARAEDWAARVGLAAMKRRRAHDLSGGEKQKLALARALVAEPDLLFLDEPTANLDGAATRDIEAILADAAKRATLVLATHNHGQARRLAREVVFLARGRIVERAGAATFFASPESAAARAFLAGEIVE